MTCLVPEESMEPFYPKAPGEPGIEIDAAALTAAGEAISAGP